MFAFFYIAFAIGIVQIQAQSCVDNGANCFNWKKNGFCTSSFYTTAQKVANCAASCGLCAPPTTVAPPTTPSAVTGCNDASVNCASMNKNGFCTSNFYPAEIKAQFCIKTCGLCNTLLSTSGSPTTPSVTTPSSTSSSPSTTSPASSPSTTTASSSTSTTTLSTSSSTTVTGSTPTSTSPSSTSLSTPSSTPSSTSPGSTQPSSSSTSPLFCSDSATNCVNFAANGFCTNPFYSDAQRRASCAKTCNLC